jgi:hypothetical protein
MIIKDSIRRSHRPWGRRHEISSLAQTLGPWVGISPEAWLYGCVLSVFVLSYGGRDVATG